MRLEMMHECIDVNAMKSAWSRTLLLSCAHQVLEVYKSARSIACI
jgi:hypothetical protein